MEEHGGKAINVGVSIILTLAIIAAVVTIVTIALRMTTTGANEATNLSGQLDESKYTRYDNSEATGDQIVSLIKQFEGDQISIAVENGGGTTYYVYNATSADFDNRTGEIDTQPRADADAAGYNTDLLGMTNKSAANYISPSKKYLCHICRNPQTDAVTVMYFKLSSLVGAP